MNQNNDPPLDQRVQDWPALGQGESPLNQTGGRGVTGAAISPTGARNSSPSS